MYISVNSPFMRIYKTHERNRKEGAGRLAWSCVVAVKAAMSEVSKNGSKMNNTENSPGNEEAGQHLGDH